jgi:hypothetical protein
LLQLRTAVADRGDITIATSGVRHTTSLVNSRINRAIQRWFNMIAEAGDDTNLQSERNATQTSTTRDANNWAPYQYITLPTTAMLIRGIDIWDGNTPIPMMTADEAERDDAQLASLFAATQATGMPVFYRIGGINAAGASIIQIFPWADAVYTMDVRFIPALEDLSNDSDAVDFIAGGEEWVINDAVMQSKMTDGLSGTADMSTIVGWNEKIEKDLRFMLACRGTTRRQDTVGRREMLKRISVGGWRLP